MISKESARVLLNLLSQINLRVEPGSVENMQALVKAQEELQEVVEVVEEPE
jgi:hypothetical protein